MAVEVFNRIENKYFVPRMVYPKLLSVLQTHMIPDSYNRDGKLYTISNLYYDTEDHFLISQSIQKPHYKEKLRLRAYGTPTEDTLVFIEIKKKISKVVNKRRTALPLSCAYEYLATGHLPYYGPEVNLQVIREIDYFLSRYHLEPQVYIAYDRMAFYDRLSPDLRISFDSNIRTRRYDFCLEHEGNATPLIPEDILLMEVKAEQSIPCWLSHLLSELKIYRTSFSKYGTEYQQFLQQSSKKEGFSCSISYFKHLRMRHLPLAAPSLH